MRTDTKFNVLICLTALLWILTMPFSSLLALDPQKTITQYKVDVWQAERGLKQRTVVSLYQSRDGYLWLGTEGGLVSFDGLRFKAIENPSHDQKGANYIWAICEGPGNYLWVGGDGGLFILKKGKLEALNLENHGMDVGVYAILPHRDGTWIGTKNNGLFYIEYVDGAFRISKKGLPGCKVYDIVEDKRGRIWIASSKGLYFHDPPKPGVYTLYECNQWNAMSEIDSLYFAKNSDLWISCNGELFRNRGNRLKRIWKNSNPSATTCLFEDSDGSLWVGTDGDGIIRVKEDGEIDQLPLGYSMNSLHIYAIFEDRQNNLWLGSYYDGLYRLRDTVFTSYTRWEGLKHNDVRCVYDAGKNGLLIATQDGINHFETGALRQEWVGDEALAYRKISDILIDKSGATWIGTDEGLWRYQNERLESMDYRNSFSGNYIESLKEDRHGGIWILSEKKCARFLKGKWELILDYKDPKAGNIELRDLTIDSKDNVWIATYGGGVIQWKDGMRQFFTKAGELINQDVESVYEDYKGLIYVCTRGGLSVIKEGGIFNVTTKNGLRDSFVRRMILDNMGYFWMAGRSGIARISRDEILACRENGNAMLNPKLYAYDDGVKNPFVYRCIKDHEGILWFATKGGVLRVDPSDYIDPASLVEPRVVLEHLSFSVDEDKKIYCEFPSNYSAENPLILPPGSKRLEFLYTGISFVNPLQVTFECELENYDEEPQQRFNLRSISYNKLDPGDYCFKVQANNGNGKHSGWVPIHFRIEPSFSQTVWYYILLVFVGLILIFYFYRLRVRTLRNRQKELKLQVDERTSEIKEQKLQLEEQSEKLRELDRVKSRFFANISHEFRTPLTLLLGPLEQMIDNCDDEERKWKLTLMMRNGQRLLRLINQLLELSKLESGKMKLKTERVSIASFVHGIVESFGFMARQKEVELVYDSDYLNGEGILFLDPRKLEDIITNLLVNAFKFTPPGGRIEVAIRAHKEIDPHFPLGYVEVSVADTGPGIPAGQLEHVFDRFYQADAGHENRPKGYGIGLALCKELVELHDGTIAVKAPDAGGSKFFLRLPIDPASTKQSDVAIPIMKMAAHERGAVEDLIKEAEPESVEQQNKPTFPLKADFESGTDNREIILVVEDSADMREYIKQALETDYMVWEAKDGKEGLETAQAIIPDLIVSDVMMPEMDGNELCRKLKEDVQTSHIPIILLSAKAEEEHILEGLETGADDYVTKPFNTRILMARIKNLIDLRNQLQQNFKRELLLRPVKTDVSSVDREFMKQLQGVLRENVSDVDFNVEEMCRKLSLSNTTLYRKIQALCGMTPTDFIRSYRLKRAAQLLKSGFGSVTEVAFEVGFASRTYFTKCFKEEFHRLPSEVRCENG